MAYKPQFGTKARDYLYSREKNHAQLNGLGDHPICPHCNLPVTPDQMWDETHIVPRAFGGKSTCVGHRECNQRDNHEVVTPAAAKARRVYQKHVGIKGPGLGPKPMQGGRRSRQRKTMRGPVVERQDYGTRHADFMRRRFFLDVEDFDGPIEVQP